MDVSFLKFAIAIATVDYTLYHHQQRWLIVIQENSFCEKKLAGGIFIFSCAFSILESIYVDVVDLCTTKVVFFAVSCYCSCFYPTHLFTQIYFVFWRNILCVPSQLCSVTAR